MRSIPHPRDMTFRDLFSPRVVYSYTIEEAWGATPRILMMMGVFLGCIVAAFLLKKLLEWIFFRRYMRDKYVLSSCEDCGKFVNKRWIRASTQHWASIGHLIVETFFVVVFIFIAIFTCAVGGIEFWTTAVGVGLLALVLSYVFGPGLQQAGSAYFVYLTNAVSYDEWWCVVGTNVQGRVVRITPFYVELESQDDENKSAQLFRVPMMTILTREMKRDYNKEANAPEVSFYEDEKDGKNFVGPARIEPKRMSTTSQKME